MVLKGGKPVQVPIAISDPGPVFESVWLVLRPGGAKDFLLTSFAEQFETLLPGTYEAHVDFWQDPFESHTKAYASPEAKFTVTP